MRVDVIDIFINKQSAKIESFLFPTNRVSNWAVRFGAQLWEIGKQATRSREIKEVTNFHKIPIIMVE